MKEKCDKCKCDIFQGECMCCTWYEGDLETIPVAKVFEKAILAYDHLYDQKKIIGPLGMDHFSGNSMVIFKGDHDMCIIVRHLINELHKRAMVT